MPDEREARHLAELLKAQGIMADVLEVPNDPPRPARDGETRDPLLSPDGVRAAWAVVDRHHGPYRRVPMVELLTAYLNAASADPLLRPPARDGETLSDAEVAAIRATALYASDHPELAAAEKVILRLCDAVAEAREDNDQYDQLNARLATILRLTANALKGEPDPLHHHSWHDLPEVATALRAQLADANGRLDEAGLSKQEILDAVIELERRDHIRMFVRSASRDIRRALDRIDSRIDSEISLRAARAVSRPQTGGSNG